MRCRSGRRAVQSRHQWKDIAWCASAGRANYMVTGVLDAETRGKLAACGMPSCFQSRGPATRGTTSTIAALPRGFCGRALRVLLDGGVTSGQCLKAMALGARACLIGKAFFGLAADGEAGVTLRWNIIRKS